MFCLDTNIISYLQAGNSRIVKKVQSLRAEEICTCSIVLAELCFGAVLNPRKTELLLKKYQVISQTMSIFDFTSKEATIFAGIKVELRKIGKIIEDFDLMIASICLANDLTLVTHNTKHFEDIEGLKVEDWVG